MYDKIKCRIDGKNSGLYILFTYAHEIVHELHLIISLKVYFRSTVTKGRFANPSGQYFLFM